MAKREYDLKQKTNSGSLLCQYAQFAEEEKKQRVITMDDLSVDIILENRLSENEINCLLFSSPPEILKPLIKFKSKLVSSHKSEKVDFPIGFIYENEDINSKVVYLTLQDALNIQKTDEELSKLVCYTVGLMKCASEEHLWKFVRLLSVVLNYYNMNSSQSMCLHSVNILELEDYLIRMLSFSSTKVRHFTATCIIPSYLKLNKKNYGFIEKIFLYTKYSTDLTLLCNIWKHILNVNSESSLLLSKDDFWTFITTCLSSTDEYLQKQAIFILSESIDFIYENYILTEKVIFQINEDSQLTVGAREHWSAYFTLLTMSREKQLHLIKPCLVLLDSVGKLPFLFQIPLYVILLNHTQNMVHLTIAKNVLTHDNSLLVDKLTKPLLKTLNKQEISRLSIECFDEIKASCSRRASKTNEIVKEALEIPWNPTAAWYFCKSVFVAGHQVKFETLFLFLTKMESLPDVRVRKACINLIIDSCSAATLSLENLLSFSKFVFQIFQVNNFLTKYLNIFELNKSKLIDVLLSHNDKFDWDKSKMILLAIRNVNFEDIKCEVLRRIDEFVPSLKDLIVLFFLKDFPTSKKEEIIKSKFSIFTGDFDTSIEFVNYLWFENCWDRTLLLAQNMVDNSEYTFTSCEKQFSFYILLKDENVRKQLFPQIASSIHKVDKNVGKCFINFYVKSLLVQKGTIELSEIDEAIALFENVFDSAQDCVKEAIFFNLGDIFDVCRRSSRIIQFVEKCSIELIKLLKLQKLNIITIIYCHNFFKCVHIFKAQEYDVALHIMSNLVSSLYINENSIKQLLFSLNDPTDKPNVSCSFLMPAFINLIFYGMIVNKFQRSMYILHKDIANTITYDDFERSLTLQAEIRMLTLEYLNSIIKTEGTMYADKIMLFLIERYRIFYKKRYFPSSEVHFQLLRIIQTMLIFQQSIKESRQILVYLLLDSFCEEAHQPCVKQLMQWLFILLFRDRESEALPLILERMDKINKNQPSAVSAFVSILYHLALLANSDFQDKVFGVILQWTMGPNFKLRSFSQAAIINLFESEVIKKNTTLITKYSFLYETIKGVVESGKKEFDEVLKTDAEFIKTFNPIRDYCLQTILVDIPKLNGVSCTEWEELPKFFMKLNHIKSFSCQTFSDRVSEIYARTNKDDLLCEDDIPEGQNQHHVQKKITPWKTILDNDFTHKNDGASDLIIVASFVEKSANLGGLTRTCEIFKVKHLMVNNGNVANDKEFKSLSMSSENWVNIIELKPDNIQSFVQSWRSEGYSIVGAEQTSQSVSLCQYKFPKKCVLILGNEKEGIPPNIIGCLNTCVEIPQLGVTRSLNVHVAASLLIWEYTKQHSVKQH